MGPNPLMFLMEKRCYLDLGKKLGLPYLLTVRRSNESECTGVRDYLQDWMVSVCGQANTLSRGNGFGWLERRNF